MKLDTDTSLNFNLNNASESLTVNLDSVEFNDEDWSIRVGDTCYDSLPVPDDTLPVNVDGDRYDAHLIFNEDCIELYIVRNMERLRPAFNGGIEFVDVTDFDSKCGDILALYLIGKLRKT